jgi:hypothetical protein
MLIGQIFFRRDSIVLRDVDGNEETLTYDDALDLHVWLANHLQEIEARNEAHTQELQRKRSNPAREHLERS